MPTFRMLCDSNTTLYEVRQSNESLFARITGVRKVPDVSHDGDYTELSECDSAVSVGEFEAQPRFRMEPPSRIGAFADGAFVPSET
jgi:hypothetical protein